MPEMDGYTTTKIIRACELDVAVEEELAADLLEQLKKRLAGNHVPIISMTAHAMSGDREKCLAVGMDAYISKPFKPVEVRKKLEMVLAGGRESAHFSS